MVASMAGVPASKRNGTSRGKKWLGAVPTMSSLMATIPPPTW